MATSNYVEGSRLTKTIFKILENHTHTVADLISAAQSVAYIKADGVLRLHSYSKRARMRFDV